MECPRCGFPQAESVECARCGIVFRKWQARETSDSAEAAAPALASAESRVGAPSLAPSARGAPGLPSAQALASRASLASKEPWFRIPRASVRDASASLSRLLHAGLGISEALRTLGTGASPRLRSCLVAISADLESGTSFADAAARHPELYDAAALQSLRTAERTGSVPLALDAIAARINATLDTQRQIFRSAIYPMGVLATSILLGPIPELMTGSAGAYVAKVLGNLALVAALLFFFAVALPRLLRTTRMGQDLRRAAWRLPWPASVYRLAVRGAFCRAFADQIEAGLPLYDALDAAAAVTVDPFARTCAAEAGAMLSSGSTLSAALGTTGLIPAGELMVLIAGERAGTLVESLRGLAIAYAERLERGIRGLLRALGFLLTIIIFAWVALGIIEAFGQVSQGTEDIFKMIEKEMPYDLR
jgi:type IV pilus assembly protein PilC